MAAEVLRRRLPPQHTRSPFRAQVAAEEREHRPDILLEQLAAFSALVLDEESTLHVHANGKEIGVHVVLEILSDVGNRALWLPDASALEEVVELLASEELVAILSGIPPRAGLLVLELSCDTNV